MREIEGYLTRSEDLHGNRKIQISYFSLTRRINRDFLTPRTLYLSIDPF